MEQKLSTADLAINLRYPSMGEASGSQLQFWDYGLPTLVTRTGWYASLPEGTTAFVRPEHEVEDMQAHLRAFLADPSAFRAMGERGRQSLDKQRSWKVCRCFDAVRSRKHCRLSPRVSALALARRVGSDLTEWLHAAASPTCWSAPARRLTTFLGPDDSRPSRRASCHMVF